MAEAIISPIAEVLFETLGSAAVQEIKALWNVEAELEDLEETIKTVKAVLIDAQKRQIRDEQVRVWLQRLEDVVYLADDLLDEISTEGLQRQLMTPAEKKRVVKKVCSLFSCCNKLATRHDMAGTIEDVKSKLAKIVADRERFHFVENMREEETNAARRSWRETRSFVLKEEVIGRETCSFVRREDVIGRDADKREILKLLLETNTHGEKVSVIPIVGMGGLGKTTLAQLVFNDESVQRHFDPKIWVCVSDVFDKRLIIEKMLKIAFNVNTKDFELEQLQNNLREKLIGKRYLLVLDDVWNENPEKWKHLKGLLMSFAEGSRIIVTTRSRKVADVMSTGIQPLNLEILDTENSWSLFKKLAFDQGVEQINSATEKVGKEIVKKCGGVPLAISMIGSMLYGKNPEAEWQSFLQKELSSVSQEENDILPTLKLSYDCLPCHLKHCFAYCRLFPKDFYIDVQTLITLWIAQGFIKSTDPSQIDLEDIGYGYFMELLWRSFFQEAERDEFDKVIICKMHDLIHDLAIQVAGGKYAMLNLEEGSNHRKILHVSFEYSLSSSNEVPRSLLQAKRLRSILLPIQFPYDIEEGQGESICDLIVSNFKFLRMLDLHVLGIKILSDSIGKLKHLRYLDLSENEEMEALPTCIAALVNLQTLRLNNCRSLKELPRDINKLVNLRYLDLSENEKMEALPTCIAELVNLQKLRLNNCDGLKELPRDINKLVNLRHLEFDDCDRIGHMPRGLSQLTKLQILSQFVLSYEGTNLESRGSELDELAWLNNLSGKLKIRGLRVGLETKAANLKEKKNLRSLYLQWDDGNVIDFSHVDDALSRDEKTIDLQPHPDLRELTLCGYKGVTLSSWRPLLTNLVNLELFKCPKCRHLPPLSQFPSLKKMRLHYLPCLEYISNEDVGDISLCKSSSCSPTVLSINISSFLQELFMTDLPKLKGWWRLPDDVAENQVKLPSFPPCFSVLSIENCPELSCMPLYPSVEGLNLIKTSWKTFEETALKAEDQASSSSSSSAVVSSSPLSKLTYLYLKQVVDTPEFLPSWMRSLTSLKMLKVHQNPKLKYLSPVIQYLTSLEELEITECEELIEISNGDSINWEALSSLRDLSFGSQSKLVTLPKGLQRATTLQRLEIDGCDNFTAVPEWICKLCSLNRLQLSNCPNLESLPASIRSLTSLRTLWIHECPTLSERCKRPTGEDWHKIQHIPNFYLDHVLQI